MSLMYRAAELTHERGVSNFEVLMACEPTITRKQAMTALRNAANKGWIHMAERMEGEGRGQRAAIYVPGPTPEPKVVKRPLPISSVWQLGATA